MIVHTHTEVLRINNENIYEDNTEKHKESIQNEILAFIDENMDSIREKMNTLDYSNSLIKNDSNYDEEIRNYNGEKMQMILNNEILFSLM